MGADDESFSQQKFWVVIGVIIFAEQFINYFLN